MLKIENKTKKIFAEILNISLFIFLFPFIFKKNKFPQKIKKIFIIRLDHIGDVIMSSSIYKEIKNKYPESELSVMIGSWSQEIIETNPYIDNLIIHDCPWWKKARGGRPYYLKWVFKELPKTLKKIKKEGFDIGIDLRGDFRHILFFLFLPNIKYKISYNRSGGSYLLDKSVKFNINQHEIEKNFKLLEEIGIHIENFERKRPEIFLQREDKYKIEEIFKSIDKNKLKIVIHPSANNPLRIWKIENFIEIIKWLISNYNPSIFIVGGSEDREIGEKIKKETDKIINLIGKLRIRETSYLIKKCNLFIGNDSSLGHIASSFNVPSLILFGPTAPFRCVPYSKFTFFIYKKMKCSPCIQKRCIITKSKKTSECMNRISKEEVKIKIEKIFEKML